MISLLLLRRRVIVSIVASVSGWWVAAGTVAGTAAAREPEGADLSRPDPIAPTTEQLSRELDGVEEEVSSLKERVFRSKATLKLLEELVVDSSIAGSRLVLWHENKLGGAYSMQSAEYFIDGRLVYTRVDPAGSLDATREIKLWEQMLAPGPHTLQVNLVLRGNGYKVFSYLRDYQFNVSSSYAFDVEDGRISVLRVVAASRGALYGFEERPTIRYDEHIENYSEE